MLRFKINQFQGIKDAIHLDWQLIYQLLSRYKKYEICSGVFSTPIPLNIFLLFALILTSKCITPELLYPREVSLKEAGYNFTNQLLHSSDDLWDWCMNGLGAFHSLLMKLFHNSFFREIQGQNTIIVDPG